MIWWWAGAIGAAKRKMEEHDKLARYKSVALVIGVTGIVGNSLAEILPFSDTLEGLWKRGLRNRVKPKTALLMAQCYAMCSSVIPNAAKLKHICLQIGRQHYSGPSDSFGKVQAQSHYTPLLEDLPRLRSWSFCYTL
ncbi:hypothetical protein V6N13_018593 [Hibiscus sabdariffa]|uniref:Uncharacterized protein n=1 Tax=Hibiscus sabdariffa TaxID=183260 RepID=A0ABR2EQB3_9ROSI